ncbi:MAG TPA: serine/threonine-protein phosphatase, partial [Candidatus Fimenecus sp.]|nr:serine/threonine-protein phosphatase [Candidatus Fimenecus sp.]
VMEHIAYIAHAGDSRAYIVSHGALNQLTRDHSVVQELVEHGKITALEAKRHPNKNIITRAVGVSREILVDF